jgi:hypothetical protein
MNITTTPDDVIKWISDTLRFRHNLVNGIHTFKFRNAERQIDVSEIQVILDKLAAKKEYEHYAIYDANSYEFLISERRPLWFRRESLTIHDKDNDFTYLLSSPSNEFTVYLLNKVLTRGSLRYLNTLDYDRASELWEKQNDIQDMLKEASRRFLTLKLTSASHMRPIDFEKHANSFLLVVK